jgi:hypothetical protein
VQALQADSHIIVDKLTRQLEDTERYQKELSTKRFSREVANFGVPLLYQPCRIIDFSRAKANCADVLFPAKCRENWIDHTIDNSSNNLPEVIKKIHTQSNCYVQIIKDNWFCDIISFGNNDCIKSLPVYFFLILLFF